MLFWSIIYWGLCMPSGKAGVVRSAAINVKVKPETQQMLQELSEAQDRSQSRLVEDMIVARYSNWKRRRGK